MTTFFLMRHGNTDSPGVVYGRRDGVHLSEHGREQARRLGERLAGAKLAAVYSSPMDRTLETAAEVTRHHGLGARIVPGLNEIDFGEWTGKSFEELEQLPRWKLFHVFRSGTRIPGGELMAEVQARMVNEIERLREQHPRQLIGVVSHGDPIKCLLAHYGGMPLDNILRFEVSPGSLSILQIGDYGPVIRCINDTGEALPGVPP